MRLPSAILCALLSTGCAHLSFTRSDVLAEAATSVASGGGSPRAQALAGFHALLLEGKTEHGAALFAHALAGNPKEPWGLYGQILLAEQAALPQRVLALALELVDHAPRHPLAAVAARLVLSIAGSARSTDAVIQHRVPKLLDRGPEGDAAYLLRTALATTFLEQGPTGAYSRTIAELGTLTVGTLLGPYSAWHRLSANDATPPEKEGTIAASQAGPFGPIVPRPMSFADGRFSLAGEAASGDSYVLAADASVKDSGTWLVRTITSMDHTLIIDGTPIFQRQTSKRPSSSTTVGLVRLSAGRHRMLVRLNKETQVGQLTVSLERVDGSPSAVTFQAATGAASNWRTVRTGELPDSVYPSAQDVVSALEGEVGETLARFVAARDAEHRDRAGALAVLSRLPASVNGPWVSMLRATLSLHDTSLPTRVARSRAARDLEATLSRDTSFISASLAAAQLALEDGRQFDALERLRQARALAAAPSAPLLTLQARVELGMDLDARAASTAQEAEAAVPGTCEALVMRFDIARRRDSAAELQRLLESSKHCPGALARTADHHRSRGENALALAAWNELLERDVGQVDVALSASAQLVAVRKLDEAVQLLTRVRTMWPRDVRLAKTLADVLELNGSHGDALALRERALHIDGGDLALRRAVERAKTGKELLHDYAITTEEALKSYEAAPTTEEATSAYVLDAAAIRVYPDGSMVDRIHILQKALDQQGVQDIAEVSIPAGAIVLKLRTLKPDGTTLEPERIEGKESISLPGVAIGDVVEYEYLLAHPSRGPGQPGFTASNFYFQISREPNARSTYVVVAPRGMGLETDAHNLAVSPPTIEGDLEVFRHEERRVPAFIPEPMSPASGTEWLPFVVVGAGEKGHEGLIRTYADTFLDNGRITHEVEAFARASTASTQGLEAVRAVYSAVMKKLSGKDSGLSVSATASVAQDRGSRTWLLTSSLRALGFDAQLVAVRTGAVDPAPYRFPAEYLFPYVCVRVRLPGQADVWLDPAIRFAPFGELPEFAAGGRDAWTLPDLGRPIEHLKTPPASERPTKEVRLQLSLDAKGMLSGEGSETYFGHDAAQLAESLETVTSEQRNQAFQSALSHYFGGAALSSINVESQRTVGGSVIIRYNFEAPRFARPEGDTKLIASSLTFPLMLGRRFIGVSRRATPLFVEASERASVTATVKLPEGWSLDAPLGEIKLTGPSGMYERRERQSGRVVDVQESFRLVGSRIVPKDYEAFARFAGEVDLVQQRDLLFEKR
jgi:tetratricopeptide (TPR) repeat protein